jgi:hypothetical protein
MRGLVRARPTNLGWEFEYLVARQIPPWAAAPMRREGYADRDQHTFSAAGTAAVDGEKFESFRVKERRA